MLLRVKLELMRRRISQQELARSVGVNGSRISRILRGHVQPRPQERVRIARVLRVPAWKLFPKAGRARLMAKRHKQSTIKESQ
jgi:transcriptional regulator with XRE-family HTH domain